MKLKKIIAAAFTASIVVGAVSVMSFSTASAAVEDVEATLKGNAGSYQFYGVGNASNSTNVKSRPAEITGDGSYTVSWDVEPPTNGTITDLYIDIVAEEEPAFTKTNYSNMNINITSIRINGSSVSNYTMSADAIQEVFENGKGITRIYLNHSDSTFTVNDLPANSAINSNIEITFMLTGIDPVETTTTTTTSDTTTTTTTIVSETKPSQINNNTPSGGSSSNGGSSSSGGNSSDIAANANVTTTPDVGIGAVFVGGAAAAALAIAAITLKKRK